MELSMIISIFSGVIAGEIIFRKYDEDLFKAYALLTLTSLISAVLITSLVEFESFSKEDIMRLCMTTFSSMTVYLAIRTLIEFLTELND